MPRPARTITAISRASSTSSEARRGCDGETIWNLRRKQIRETSSLCRLTCRIRKSTPARAEPLECVLVRSDGEAVAITLDIEPVEKPENVLWVDPVHRDPNNP